jgi:hypothetical protein
MNTRQRIILFAGIVVFALMGLFPPWKIAWKHDPRFVRVAQYSFIFEPDIKWGNVEVTDWPSDFMLRLDFDRLVVQWIVAIVFFGGMILIFSDRKR